MASIAPRSSISIIHFRKSHHARANTLVELVALLPATVMILLVAMHLLLPLYQELRNVKILVEKTMLTNMLNRIGAVLIADYDRLNLPGTLRVLPATTYSEPPFDRHPCAVESKIVEVLSLHQTIYRESNGQWWAITEAPPRPFSEALALFIEGPLIVGVSLSTDRRQINRISYNTTTLERPIPYLLVPLEHKKLLYLDRLGTLRLVIKRDSEVFWNQPLQDNLRNFEAFFDATTQSLSLILSSRIAQSTVTLHPQLPHHTETLASILEMTSHL